jgi:hypothetical protein
VNGDIWHYNSEYLKQIGNSLSHSEKTLLIFFMNNYSSSICNSFFSIEDISMHVSIWKRDKIAFITELFERYPYFFNGNNERNEQVEKPLKLAP